MRDRMRRCNMLITFMVLLCLFLVPFSVKAEEGNRTVIRVGYPAQEGFTDIDGNGSYSGYTYEYLQEIAKYTNWEYEYVTLDGSLDDQLSEMLVMLKNGEIDIMGAMNYSESLSEIFDYPEYSYGTAYKTLSVLKGNLNYTEFDYDSFEDIRVAVISHNGQEDEKLNRFAAINGFAVKQILCSSGEEQMARLKAGEADAILGMNVSLENEDLRVISRFDSRPFYFAVTKGNLEVARGLNKALELILSVNSDLPAELNRKYFTGDEVLVLSKAEQEYISQKKTVKAGVMLGRAPLQYRDRAGELRGISIEVLNYIQEHTGLVFDIIPFDNWEEYEAALTHGELDIVTGVAENYEEAGASGYTLTLSYLYSPLQLVMNERVENLSDLSDKKIALLKMSDADYRAQPEVLYYDSAEECMEAVHNGTADYCYANSYTVQYYTASHNYKNLITFAQSENWSRKYCFGVRKPVDLTLLSIMNKVLKALPEEQANHFLYDNAYDAGELTFSEYIMRNPQQSVLYLILFWLIVITAVLITAEIIRRRNMTRKKLENQRYEQLSELSNEFLYEYDIREGCLHLTEQTAGFLGCERNIRQPEKMKDTYPVFGYMISQEECNAERECLLPGGSVRWLKIVSKTVTDATGRPWYAVGKLVDIQKEREDKEQLKARAQRDSLTGVYNSATGRLLMSQAIAEKTKEEAGAMIIMDIDYFKQVNDYLGHYTGDEVLCEAAEVLMSCFRADDIVGRLGGDEFVVFMRSVTDPAIVKQRCEEVMERMKAVSLEKHGEEVTLSIGAAMVGEAQEYDLLYRKADQALYQVKKNGRNGVMVMT